MATKPSDDDIGNSCVLHIAEVQIAKIRCASEETGRFVLGRRGQSKSRFLPPDPQRVANADKAYRDRYAQALKYVKKNCSEEHIATLHKLKPPSKPGYLKKWLKTIF